ncbi:pyrroloquinoline quinone biosynthesis protein PqqB [Pseudonocardia sp. KRD-184]|uniref:Coenzyme PQQ synthesis protein B n=4 Tax=Pseudonocardia oceani TaxID=2792013 RepID=A0ABS6UH21_9PSEU|nr:pyrroloquinoline quinone biosynthesis protein PqqB [Pseudonocardia oceani]MBW0096256.1 pyrroloquinoline quinone biosynthesis protein PqqB [Pseudonocardia oceani]MBW0120135.1 pyrroloquinoline quinone biosynthesis protein PqqB [Pseudonocardia oceani]MBW0131555.1 pyrroloquinoline quinone biosynthesis protein PqqB [Pseudonocardia oceani]
MRVRVLGSAAGGGYPQWNCSCPTCRAVREGTRPARTRTQSSIAVSPDGERWFLVNASPDVRAQVEAFPRLHPGAGRATPLEAVLLTDAELDHTLGLLLLREGRGIELHATAATHATLTAGTGVLTTLERYCPVGWTPVVPGKEVSLGGVSYRAFDAPTGKHDRFGGGTGTGEGRVVGYRFTDEASGAAAVYLPGVQELTPAVLAELEGVDCLLVDGTCWHDDEMIRLGLAAKTAHGMGHLAVGGPGGSLEQLAGLPIARRIYVHINNTNPMLLEDSPERREVERCGMEVAHDGLEVEVPAR